MQAWRWPRVGVALAPAQPRVSSVPSSRRLRAVVAPAPRVPLSSGISATSFTFGDSKGERMGMF